MLGNKTVFVTGSSRGIGKATAALFAAEGYNVAIMCKSSTRELEATYKELTAYTPDVLALQGDLSDYTIASSAVSKIINKFGGIDVLVNNAGISYMGLFNTMKPQDWKNVIDNNLYSTINCTHLVLQDMIKEHRGNIVNISSMWGQTGASCEAIYSATKGAINAFTRSLAKELAPSKIRVNAIACGVIDTKMNSFLTVEEKYDLMNEIPMGRFGTPEEVAKLALFLAEKDSSYMTGQIINLDGGMI